jgi:magnesium transporter
MTKNTNQKKRNKYINHNVFQSAGTLNYIGKEVADPLKINYVGFSPADLNVLKNINPQEIEKHFSKNHINWLDIIGFHEVELIEKIGKKLKLHPLLLEDVVNTTQKPKMEYFEKEKHLFVVLKVPRLMENKIENEHIALVLGKDFVLSFQELDSNDVFEPIIARLKRENSKTRSHQADYLFYSLIDLVIDNYFLVIRQLEDKMEDLEEAILHHAKTEHQNQLFFVKREIATLRKTIIPIRDITNLLIRDPFDTITSEVKVYLRDVMDHILEHIDNIDALKEDIENLMTNYHSQLSNRMNVVMKTLTVFTAIFMPLTFIAGIYGMNFENMPELRQPNGYYYTLFAMFCLSIGLWLYFKWKKYI